MSDPGSNEQQNTREFLPPTQAVSFVPMTEEDFKRQGRKRIYIWIGAIAAVALIVAGTVWKSSQPAKAQTDYDDALKLFNAGRYAESIPALDRAIAGKTHLLEAYRLRGSAYRFLNKPEQAAQDFTRVIELDPDAVDERRKRAESYRELGRLEEALQDYDFVIFRRPDADTYNGRGICFRDLKRMERAIADFTRAIDLEPSVDNLLQRGMAYSTAGDQNKAIADFDRVIEIRPEMPYTYRARAFSRDAIGDHAGAAEDREKARAIEYPNRRTRAAAEKKSS